MQWFGVSEEQLGLLETMVANGWQQPPVTIVEYDDDQRGEVGLLFEGTHRAFIALSQGRCVIDAEVWECDADWQANANPGWVATYPSLGSVRDECFARDYRPGLIEWGIQTVADLQVFPGSKEDLFAYYNAA